MPREYKKKVSVIMGVYNQWDQGILKDAVNSILQQTFRDFEFIIYNDGSDAKATEYIQGLSELDERIILIGKEENLGLAFSLNACIKHAKGKYIARMDADDISLPTRLDTQVRFLEEHPEYMWCGTNATIFDEEGEWGERNMPERPDTKDYLKFSPYIHPSVMYRANIFEDMDGYTVSDETLRCEDYEIFMRFHQAGYQGYNLQENLLLYREDNASYKRRKLCFRINEAKIRYRNFKSMGILFPTGWIYVLRPIAACFIPNRLLLWHKRTQAREEQNANRTHEQENGLLQPHIAEETHL